MEINNPAVLEELMDRHKVYEKALVENDVPMLDSLFWDSPHALRYGVGENLHGAEEIRAFRQARSKIGLDRTISRLEIMALGPNLGVNNLEFVRVHDGVERRGRQSQVWIRFPDGWKIVSAHVSLLPGPPAYTDAAATRIGLDLHPGDRAAVSEDLNRISSIAKFLMEFPLNQDVQAASVFQP